MRLSRNFDLSEFLVSQTAEREGGDMLAEQQNPSDEVINNLRYLCQATLQPVRNLINKSIIVSSGYRCLALNTAIGGSKTSQHMKGQAADLQLKDTFFSYHRSQRAQKVIDKKVSHRIGKSLRDDCNANFYLFALAALYLHELDVDQLIHEFGRDGAPAWIHISASLEKNRRQILVARRGRGHAQLTVEEALRLGA